MNSVEVADLLESDINGRQWSRPFRAERVYVPTYDTSRENELKCTILVVDEEEKRFARRLVEIRSFVEVGIIERFIDPFEKPKKDALVALCTEIKKFYKKKILGEYTCVKTTYRPIYSDEDMRTKQLFVGVIMVEFLSHYKD